MKKIFKTILILLISLSLTSCEYFDFDNNNNNDNNNSNHSYDYEITYHTLNNNEDKIIQKYNHGEILTYPNRPEKQGYIFRGWYTNLNFNEKYQFGSEVNDSFNLYAKWEEPNDDELLFDELFNLENKVTIELDIDDEELQKIQNDYDYYSSFGSKSPIYRYANSLTITINDDVYHIEEVGVRMKGNTSRTNFYNNQDGYYNQIHLKFDFSSTFDDEEYYGNDAKVWTDSNLRKERKDRTFAGLKKLDIKWNKNLDQTYAKELYSLDFFKDEGIIAQNINTTNFLLKNNNKINKMGVFYLYEVIDESFIKRHMPEENLVGDLYKAGWANIGDGHKGADLNNNSTYGVEDEDLGKFYNYDLKTNKKTSNHDDLKKLLNELNKNKNIDTLSKYVDIDYMLKFEAINYLVGNPDDIRNNYNNHYIYFRNDHKMIIIPYDYDRVLGINKDYNPSGNGMMYVDVLEKKAVGVGSSQVNPIYQIILNSTEHSNNLLNLTKQLVETKWFDYNHFDSYYNKIYNKHKNDVVPTINFHNVDQSRLQFDINRGTDNYGSTNSNINIKTYFKEKKKTVINK